MVEKSAVYEETYAQSNVSNKLFPLSLFAYCFLHILLCTLSKALRKVPSDLIRFKSSALFNTITVSFPSLHGSEFLWRCCGWSFFKLWEKATSGLQASVSAVIQNPGILMPRAPRCALTSPQSDSTRCARKLVLFFIALCLFISGFIDCNDNVAVA